MNIRDRVKEFRRVPASELRPNPKNWRTHPKEQQDALRGLLAEVGFAGAELCRELPDGSLMLIDGHCRAEIMGTNEVPCLILDVTEAEADKLLATFDPIGAMAGSDRDKLDSLLREVQTESQDVAKMLEELGKQAGCEWAKEQQEIVEDEVPEPPVVPITQPGDLWIMGDHRLLCGDSTKAEDVGRLMAGAKADAIISDPPYGMNYTGCAAGAQQGMQRSQRRAVVPVVGDDGPFDPWPVVQSFGTPHEVMLWGGDWFYDKLPPGGSIVVWDKRASIAADATPGAPFEILWSMTRRAREFIRHPWGGWINKEKGDQERHHPTQKPVICMSYPMDRASKRGDVVADPFLGSGTTLIAAEQLNRRCYAMEISPLYCDVAVARWEKLTGKKATRQPKV